MAKGGQVAHPFYYIKGGGVLPPLQQLHTKSFAHLSLLLSPSLFPLLVVPQIGTSIRGLETWDIGEFSTIRTPSCCWTPGPDLSSSAALLDWSLGDVIYTVCVRVLRGAALAVLIIAGASTRQ